MSRNFPSVQNKISGKKVCMITFWLYILFRSPKSCIAQFDDKLTLTQTLAKDDEKGGKSNF